MSDTQKNILHLFGLIAGVAVGAVVGFLLGVSRLEMMALTVLGAILGRAVTWALMKAMENRGVPRGKRRLEGWRQPTSQRGDAETPESDE